MSLSNRAYREEEDFSSDPEKSCNQLYYCAVEHNWVCESEEGFEQTFTSNPERRGKGVELILSDSFFNRVDKLHTEA